MPDPLTEEIREHVNSEYVATSPGERDRTNYLLGRIDRLEALVESERQASRDYHEEILAAHDDRDRYKAVAVAARALVDAAASDDPDAAEHINLVSAALDALDGDR